MNGIGLTATATSVNARGEVPIAAPTSVIDQPEATAEMEKSGNPPKARKADNPWLCICGSIIIGGGFVTLIALLAAGVFKPLHGPGWGH
jgi:hypothetical protein